MQKVFWWYFATLCLWLFAKFDPDFRRGVDIAKIRAVSKQGKNWTRTASFRLRKRSFAFCSAKLEWYNLLPDDQGVIIKRRLCSWGRWPKTKVSGKRECMATFRRHRGLGTRVYAILMLIATAYFKFSRDNFIRLWPIKTFFKMVLSFSSSAFEYQKLETHKKMQTPGRPLIITSPILGDPA